MLETISVIILGVSFVAIAIQAQATAELVKNGILPVVDVCIIYSQTEGTIVHFLNKKQEIPARVWVKIEILVNGKKIYTDLDPRFSGEESWSVMHVAYKTAGIKELDAIKSEFCDQKVEISLETYLAPLFSPNLKSKFHKKSYKFDFQRNKWVDTFWGISDEFVIHPNFRVIKS